MLVTCTGEEKEFIYTYKRYLFINNAFAPRLHQYVLAMFLAYPLAFILSKIKSPSLKHLFSFAVGLWYSQQIFGSQWIHSFITITMTYLIVKFGPQKHIHYIVSFSH